MSTPEIKDGDHSVSPVPSEGLQTALTESAAFDPWSTNGTFVWPTSDRAKIQAIGHHIAFEPLTASASEREALCNTIVRAVNWCAAYGCATCGNKVGAKHENACAKRGHLVTAADCFVPQSQEQQPTTPMNNIEPTYYVRHPDGTISIAVPQPTPEQIAAQADYTYAQCDRIHGGGVCPDPDCYRAACEAPAEARPTDKAVDPLLVESHQRLAAALSEAESFIMGAMPHYAIDRNEAADLVLPRIRAALAAIPEELK